MFECDVCDTALGAAWGTRPTNKKAPSRGFEGLFIIILNRIVCYIFLAK